MLISGLPAATPALAATYTFTSIADSYTNSARPTSNYGTQTSVRVRNSSTSHRAYLRFNVAGLDAAVQSAKLRLFVADASPQGGTVHRTSGGWTETGLNSNNAPALDGTVLATAGKVVAGTWIELDVTSAVTGNGDVNLGIQTTSSNSTLYASREAAEDPTLVVTTASGPPPAPVADFSGTPLSGAAPLQVAFTDLSTNSPTSWAWDFQNDGTVDSTSKNPIFTYSTPGTYDVRLTATNAGGSDSKLVTGYVVVAAPPAPVANFSGTPLSGAAPLQVAFTDLSTNSPTTWAWDFQNDGTVDSTSKNPIFTYSTPGTYDVRLTATNAGGSDSKLVTGYVVVSPAAAAPVAQFSATPTDGIAPLQVTFTDGSTGGPTSWAWDFQNDGTVDSTVQNPTMTYSTPGSYDVRLTVSNTGGSDSQVITDFIVVGAPPSTPVADFSATPTSGSAPLTVVFTDASSNAPTSWAWDFQNDGETDSTVQNPSFVYSSPGTYAVRLTATNAGGSDAETKTGLVVVGSGGGGSLTFVPIADSQVKSTSPTGNYGTAVSLRLRNSSEIYRSYLQFTVSGLTGAPTGARLRLLVADSSPDGGRIHTVANTWTETGIVWNNAPVISGTALSSVGPVTIGTWVEFDVGAAVTGNGTYSFGILNNSSDSALYSSRESADSPELIVSTSQATPPPVAGFTGVPTSGSAPLNVQFTDTSTSGPNAWAWDFQNDGTVDSTARNPRFTYTSAGTYSVKLTASNSGGSDTFVRTSYVTVAAGPAAGPGDVTFVGAGDIAACNSSGDEATAALINGIPGTVYTTGDNAYETGTATEFANCYGPSWGQFKARTRPAVGNHEYGTPNANGYFGYFGAAAGDPTKGYYSYDLGAWHIVVLNSNCSEIGGCGVGSAQETWLRQDLATNTDACTLGIWHEPRFNSGVGGGATFMVPLLQALYDDGAEVVLNGHMHFYERFAPQTPAGVANAATGIRQFTVGTGGKSLAGFATIAANSEIRDNQTFGVLRLTLHANGYTWQFVPVAGKTFSDVGSGFCH
jgi:PKD repeat protein